MVDLLALFKNVRRSGEGWTAVCPGHDDHTASLSIGCGADDRWLIKCHAGCDPDAIVAAVNLEPRDLFRKNGDGTSRRMVAVYDYHTLSGKLLYQVCRFDPKDFRQRRPDDHGGYTWSLKGVERVLYRLPELRGKAAAFIVEGEKDCDRLTAMGLPATTCAGGATKWKAAYVEQLIEVGVQRVAVIPDNDGPGRKHAEQVAASCRAAGLEVRIVTVPDVPDKGDVSDYLDTHTKTDLVQLAKTAPLFQKTVPRVADEATPPGKTTTAVKQGHAVLLEDPEPWPEPVDGVALLDAIAGVFSRYLAMPPHASTALALWVVHAYAFDAWFASPFLAITSPTKRCGKTLLLIILGALISRRLFAANVTPAVLFRAIEKYRPVLLIDEADSFIRNSDELRGVLNSGHTRTTAVVIRAVGDDHDSRAFSTWCPKAIALIGKLPDTLADRAIEVSMRRRTARETVARLRQDQIEAECADWRRQAVRWATDHQPVLQAHDPPVPATLHDRAADCWRPLLAVADVVGGSWRDRAREAARALSGEATDGDDIAVQLLHDVRAVFEEADATFMSSSQLVTKLAEMDSRPWADWRHGKAITTRAVADRLRPFGVVPVSNRTERGYHRDRFKDAWTRYSPPEVSQRHKVNDSGGEVALANRHAVLGGDTLQSEETPIETGAGDTVTVSPGEKGSDRARKSEKVPPAHRGEGAKTPPVRLPVLLSPTLEADNGRPEVGEL